MADLVSTLNGYMEAAAESIGDGDYDGALRNALAAQAIAGALPKASRAAGASGGTQSVDWDRAAIERFIVNCRQTQAASLGVRAAAKRYDRVTDD
jgi:hypothetical protein